jgi:uncharacterized protein YbaP (TraB family)
MIYRIRRAMMIIFLLGGCLFASSQQWPATLHWRISGNGLTKPSYLYGTMHLQDKRLFNFGDSVYQHIKDAEGFALELNFHDLLDSMFSKQIEEEETKFMEKADITIDRKKLDKGSDSLLKKLGIKGNNLSKKDLKKIRDYQISQMVQEGEMQTIVDGYLYGLALRQSKWTGGIEDVSDQMNVLDEFGKELSPDNILQPAAVMKKSVEDMIQTYLKPDLQKLAGISDEDGWRDRLLIQRNIKMARRMDSLMSFRTMFFAIGAAHLAGDSGVISLLRKRGFQVDPVFSSKKIPGENFIKTLDKVSWNKVVDPDNLYSIQMPGNPSDYNMLGQALKMKIFFDLPTMTFYMTGATLSAVHLESDLDKVFGSIAERMGVVPSDIKRKKINQSGIMGFEGSFEAPQGFYTLHLLQKNNILYMIMAGSAKKINLMTDDVQHFFTSFQSIEAPPQKKEWVKFELPEKAFSVMLPGQPRANRMVDKNAEGSGWNFTTYDYIDNSKAMYYVAQVRDIGHGYYLDGDSSYFSLYLEDFRKKFDTVLNTRWTTFEGFPAFHMEAKTEKDNLVYKVFNVIRGNRIYTMMVGGQEPIDSSDENSFFSSFRMLPYVSFEWKTYHANGFQTSAPGPIVKEKEDDQKEHFVSFNAAEAVSYEVFRDVYDSLFWAENDSVFFDDLIKSGLNVGDTILKKSKVFIGGLEGFDLLIRKPDNNNLKRIRIFLNGDTLYTLVSFIASQYINNPDHERFFTDFRVSKEHKTTIFQNKAAKLLSAMQTTDSVTFENATSVFNTITFTQKDLPLLHRALFFQYRDAGEGSSVHDRIVRTVIELADTSTVGFIERNYHSLDKINEGLKYPILNILATIHTSYSYDVLKKLLFSRLPEKGNAWSLVSSLSDAPELTKSLYPDILRLSNDSIFSYVLVAVTVDLVDSNLLQWNDVIPYEKNFLNEAQKILQGLKEDNEQWWIGNFRIRFISRFNDQESNDLLREFVKLPGIETKQSALLALARNNQPLNPADVEKVATDKSTRGALYDELKKMGKEKLFPVKYATQKSLSESEILSLANEENDPTSIVFLSEKTAVYEGKKKRFYLYRVSYSGKDGTEKSFLGITGPYELSGGKLLISSDASTVLFSKPYDRLRVDKQLRAHLDEMEKYKRESSADNN